MKYVLLSQDDDLYRAYNLMPHKKQLFTILKQTMYRRIYLTVFETKLEMNAFSVLSFDHTFVYNEADKINALQFWKEGRLKYQEVYNYLRPFSEVIEYAWPHETIIVRNCPKDALSYLKLRYGELITIE